jgi:hypothetical protein
MVNNMVKGNFAHVVGTFNLAERTGTIDYVTPVNVATESSDLKDEGIHLIGEDAAKKLLFDKVVNPQRNSCAPDTQKGTFEEFVPVSPQLRSIRLAIGGSTAAEFSRGAKSAPGAITFSAPNLDKPNRLSLDAIVAVPTSQGVTYAVQAKAEGSDHWQTLAVGLPTPNTNVDVNQFPGAKSVDVRILQSDGFSETEVFRDTKTF